MAVVKLKGEGGLRWIGRSGKIYTITSFGTTEVSDELDLKQLVALGDFIVEGAPTQTKESQPLDSKLVLDELIEESKPKRSRKRREA